MAIKHWAVHLTEEIEIIKPQASFGGVSSGENGNVNVYESNELSATDTYTFNI